MALAVDQALLHAAQMLETGQLNRAVQLSRQVLLVDADNSQALHILAIVANRTGRPERALEILGRALGHGNTDPALKNTLALILARLGRLEEAETELRQCIAAAPDQRQTHLNLASILERRNAFAEALKVLSETERRFGTAPDILAQRAIFLQSEGRFDDALAVLDSALPTSPDSLDIRFARANLLLLMGRMDEGWPDFELRRHRRLGRAPPLDRPFWSGVPNPDERILVYAEHGLGDTIQFARYVPHLQNGGVDVAFACYPALVPLMRSLGIGDRLFADDGPLPDCDAVAPLMSLPHLLGQAIPEIETLGAAGPYLHADPRAVEDLKAELGKVAGVKVGLAWQGNPQQSTDADRSIPIEHFAPLFAVPGVTIVSLQRGHGERDIDVFKTDHEIVDWPSSKSTMHDTANLIAALDLVVTTDTAMAHLAGALGQRTWLLVSAKPSWRWLLMRDDSPWYPTMRLFRQKRFRDWARVFDAVVGALYETRPGTIASRQESR